jgi:ankyrin repeat protein
MLLKNDFAVAQKPAYGALTEAINNKDMQTVEDLLRRDVDINEMVENLTPLMRAVWRSDEELARLLLEHGADVNIKNIPSGCSAIVWAATEGHTRLTCLLMDKLTDINEKDNNGNTVLMWAAINGRTEIVHMLLDNGADMTIKNESGRTAQDLAARNGYTDVARIFQEIVDAAEARQRCMDEAERVRVQHDTSSGKQESMKRRARNMPKPGGLTWQN